MTNDSDILFLDTLAIFALVFGLITLTFGLYQLSLSLLFCSGLLGVILIVTSYSEQMRKEG